MAFGESPRPPMGVARENPRVRAAREAREAEERAAEERAEVVRMPERRPEPQPDRQAQERAAEDRARQRNVDNLRSTLEQIGAQIAGVDARIRAAEQTGNAHANDQWSAMKRSLERTRDGERAKLEALISKKAA